MRRGKRRIRSERQWIFLAVRAYVAGRPAGHQQAATEEGGPMPHPPTG